MSHIKKTELERNNYQWNEGFQNGTGRVQKWESVCWGVLGIPYLKIERFKVSWFLGFLVVAFLVWGVLGFWFLGLKVYWFIGFSVSNSFNVFWNYLVHNTKFRFHVFYSYWTHNRDFQDSIKRIFGICRCPSFRKSTTCWISVLSENCESGIWKIFQCISFILCRCPGVSKDK